MQVFNRTAHDDKAAVVPVLLHGISCKSSIHASASCGSTPSLTSRPTSHPEPHTGAVSSGHACDRWHGVHRCNRWHGLHAEASSVLTRIAIMLHIMWWVMHPLPSLRCQQLPARMHQSSNCAPHAAPGQAMRPDPSIERLAPECASHAMKCAACAQQRHKCSKLQLPFSAATVGFSYSMCILR
jgi:hypothetical protein